MNPLNILKATLADNLEKQGSSLYELDLALNEINNIEGQKKAAELLKKAFGPTDAITGGAKLYGAGLGLTGLTGATALDSADKVVQDENKKLKILKDKSKLLHKLIEKIHQENL